LSISTVEPPNEGEERAGFAFFAVLLLYGQLIGIGIFVAMGVVRRRARASSSCCSRRCARPICSPAR
jgi:hypothetical protein